LKQLSQNVRTGKLSVAEVSPPLLREQGILVRNYASLVSAGTECTMLELARKGLIGKAPERPALAPKVLDKLRRAERTPADGDPPPFDRHS